MSSKDTGWWVIEPDGRTSLQEIEDNDLAEYMRLEDSRDAGDTAEVLYNNAGFILHNEDGLVGRLSKVSHDGTVRRTVRVSMPRTESEGDQSVKAPQDDKFEFTVVLERRKSVGSTEGARLASKTREHLARVQSGSRLHVLNVGLGAAVFATMSATSLVVLSPPLSYVFAAGALAPAGIMLARAARSHV